VSPDQTRFRCGLIELSPPEKFSLLSPFGRETFDDKLIRAQIRESNKIIGGSEKCTSQTSPVLLAAVHGGKEQGGHLSKNYLTGFGQMRFQFILFAAYEQRAQEIKSAD
jgi:hypothetical protein